MTTDRTPEPASETDIVLRVEDLEVTFFTEEGAVQAVRGISFELRRGSILAIVGESGSGKSVTAFSILKLIQEPGRITGGKITFYPKRGEPIEISSLSEKDNRLFDVRGGYISMIFQEPMTALSPVHTIGNQICEAILLHQDVSEEEARRLAVEMIDKVGIPKPESRLGQYPHELSGGMRQRVVIAMALVCRPEILIADEPTTALDVTIQAQILQLIKGLQREMGTSVIFITHDLGVVAQTAEYVNVMFGGRILEKGTVRQILKDPWHPYSKGLLAAIPSIDHVRDRLPTIDSIVGDYDILTPRPLLRTDDGREVALDRKEIDILLTERKGGQL
jgi:ABC-type dipeptide/oligopeptide/nickel transport system ATPase component